MRRRLLLPWAAIAPFAIALGLATPAVASSSGRAARAVASSRPGAGLRGVHTGKSDSFAGYSYQGGGEGTWTVTTHVVVPKLKCSSGAEKAIALSVGVYNVSGHASAADLFAGCYKGKATYFPSLEVNGVTHNYVPLKAHPGDKVTLHVSQSAKRTVVSVKDVSRSGVSKTLHGAGSKQGSSPWVGTTGWVNPGLLGVPKFGKIHYSGSTLDGTPFASAASVARWNRYKGSTLQIETSAFASNHESFTTTFKHS